MVLGVKIESVFHHVYLPHNAGQKKLLVSVLSILYARQRIDGEFCVVYRNKILFADSSLISHFGLSPIVYQNEFVKMQLQ